MKRTLVIVVVLCLLLVTSCAPNIFTKPPEDTVDPETFIIVDRQTGRVYNPDLEPRPEIVGSTITFTQDGKAFILCGNWMVIGELYGD